MILNRAHAATAWVKRLDSSVLPGTTNCEVRIFWYKMPWIFNLFLVSGSTVKPWTRLSVQRRGREIGRLDRYGRDLLSIQLRRGNHVLRVSGEDGSIVGEVKLTISTGERVRIAIVPPRDRIQAVTNQSALWIVSAGRPEYNPAQVSVKYLKKEDMSFEIAHRRYPDED
jgi:hypothetical protein